MANGTVDERIVEMQIDHDKFESGAKKTLNILEKLDRGLKSLGKNNADGFDAVASALDKVTSRFSAMGIAGDQIIRNLTNRAIALVDQLGMIAKSLSLDQINAGWDKYAEKTQGVQTIMAATAKDWSDQAAQMDYVNAQLEKLNWFTDETSYNFLDMVNNIGKFTSNGVKLETAVTAMEGISTWAAMSGANVGEASRAMYNLSQALATGSVKLIDWKSIENANMATREFKETALETAASLGKLIKVGNKWKTQSGKVFTTEQFNTQLSEGWFSSDVLLETLNKYGAFTDVLNEATEATGLTATEMLKAIDAYEETGEAAAELLPWLKKLSNEEYALGRKAFKAAQEAKTYEDALNATKDAVSTGWMNLFEMMFGNYLTAKVFWTDVANSLYEIFAEPVNKLIEIFDRAFNGPNPLKDYLAEAGYTMADLESAATNLSDDALTAIIEEYGSLEEAIKAGAISAEQLQKILNQMQLDKMEQIVSGKNDEFNSEIEKLKQYAEWFISGAIDEETMAARGIDVEMVKWWAEVIQKETEEAKAAAKEIRSSKDKSVVDYEKAKAYLKKNGLTMKDLETAASELGNPELDKIIKKYGSLKEAIKNGAISVEQFQSLLTQLHGDDADPNIVKFMNQYSDQLLKMAGYTDEEIEKLKEMGLTAEDILGEMTDVEVTRPKGTQLFTEGLLNLLKIVEDVGGAIRKAYNIIFGGVEDDDLANNSLGERLYQLIVRFNKFTKAIQLDEKQLDSLKNKFVGILSAIRTFNNILGTAFRIAKQVASFIIQVIKRSGILGSLFRSIKLIFEGLLAPVQVIIDYFKELFNISEENLKQTWIEKLSFWLGKLGVKINAAAYKFKEFMSSSKIAEWLTKQLDRLVGLVTRFASAFSKDGISGVFNELETMVRDFAKEHPVLWSIYTVISRIINIFKTGFSYVKDFFYELSKVFVDLDISGLFEDFSVSKLFSVIKQLASDVIQLIIDTFSKVFDENGPLSKLKGFIGPALLLLIGKNILGTIKKAKKAIGGVGDIVENLVGFTSRLKKGPSTFKEFATNILMIAISIGILAGSLVGLAKLSWPELLRGFVGLASIMGMLALMSNNTKSIKEKGFSGFLALAVSVLILAMTLKSLAKLNWEELLRGVIAIGAITGMLWAMSKYAKSIKSKGFAGFLALAISVLILAMTLKSLAKLTPIQLLTGLTAMVGIMLMLLIMSRYAKSIKSKGFAGFLALAISVLILAMTLKSLAKLTPKQLLTGLTSMVGIMLMLLIMSRYAKSIKSKGFAGFLALAVSILILAMTLKSLAKLTPEQLLTGLTAMTGIILMLLIMSRYAKSVTTKGFGQLILLAVSVVIFGAVLYGLAQLSWQQMLVGIISIGAVVAMLIGITRFTKSVTTKGFGQLILLAVSVAIFGAVLYGLAQLSWQQMIVGIISIGAIVAMLIAVTKYTKSVKTKGFAQLILLAVALVIVAGALALLARFPWQNILAAAAALAIGVVALVALAIVIEGLGSIPISTVAKGLAVLAAIAIGVELIVWAFIAIGSFVVDSAIKLAEKLAIFAESLKPFTEAIKGFDSGTSDNFKTFANMMLQLMVAEFWILIASVLSKLGDGEAMAKKLSSFMNELQPFLSSVTSVTAESVEAAGRLASMMASLLGAQITSLVGSWLDGLNPDYATSLSEFMTAFVPFTESVKSVTQEVANGAGYLAATMASLLGAQITSLVGSWIDGLNADYAIGLSSFMVAFVPFTTLVSSVTADTVTGAGYLAATMASLLGAQITSLVGSWFDGLNTDYAIGLSSFMVAFVPFTTLVSSVTADTVTGAGYLAATMASLLGAQVTSLVGSWIDGLNTGYAIRLSSFMESFKPFTESVKSVTQDAVTGAGRLATMMGKLVGAQFTADVGSWFDGLNSENATKLSEFMVALQGFLNDVAAIDQTKLDGAANLTDVMQAAFGASFWTAVGSWFGGSNASYATQLSEFTTALTPFLENMSSIDTSMLTNVQDVFTTLSTLTQSNVIQLFGSQLQSFYENLEGNSSSGLFGGKEGLVEKNLTSFKTAVSTITDFVSALMSINGKTFDLDNISSALSSTLDALSIDASVIGSAESVGSNVVGGIAAGVTGNLAAAYTAGANAGDEVVRGFRDATRIESPSKVFMALAEYIPAGIAKGVENNTDEAVGSMSILSSAVLSAMEMAMANVATIADSDFDISPTITPVVDMSNVEFAAGNTGRMFGSIGAAARGSMRIAMDTAGSANSSTVHDNGSGNIVSELKSMSGKFDALESAVRSMQIVLDTGELVGSTYKKMDGALGTAQVRKSRAN